MKKIWIVLILLVSTYTSFSQTKKEFNNWVGSNYTHQTFSDKFTDRIFSNIEYADNISDETFIARVNYAARNGLQGNQYGLSYYPKYERGYWNVAAAYSENNLFPRLRLVGERWRSLPQSWEYSLGGRMVFLENKNISPITIYTGSLNKYVGNFWLSFRTNLVPIEDVVAKHFILSARKYGKSKYDFIGIQLFRGFDAVDNLNITTEREDFLLDVYMIRLEVKKSLSESWKFNSAVNIRDEFIPFGVQDFVSSIALQVGIRKLF